ncbi:MAG: hypothetical protein KAH97_02910 [Anaerolineales bacterium]|nr:hypothetical protein [Anaerolineales bacterium]
MKTHERIHGVKIYDTQRDFSSLFEEWRTLRINSAFVSGHLLSRNSFREMAHAAEITLFVILPIFYDKKALKDSPELYAVTSQGKIAEDEWVRFVCPSREEFLQKKIEYIINLIREFQPDGISLDFIRHFVFWEKVLHDRKVETIPITCFDKACVSTFQEKLNIEIPDFEGDVMRLSEWIMETHRDDWVNWKCELITKIVQRIHDAVRGQFPACLINLHAIPWREMDFEGAVKRVAGQNIEALSHYVDMVSPMCYAHMLKRDSNWIHSVVEDVSRWSNAKVVPSIQVSEHYLSERLTVDEFQRSLSAALRPPSTGVVYWSWNALEEDPQKKEIIRSTI